MITANILVGHSKKTLGFSGSFKLRSKVFDTTLHIIFTECDLRVPTPPESNMNWCNVDTLVFSIFLSSYERY